MRMSFFNGKIIKALAGFYYVEVDGAIYECKARGIFRKSNDKPVVGDDVEISIDDNNKGVVEKIHARKNLVERPLVSNINKLFIISSLGIPSPNALIIDRLCAVAEKLSIEPIIVFNKSDQGDIGDWQKIYTLAGYKTIICSAQTKEGINDISNELVGCICAFAGNTGVGKSSIINAVFDGLELKTGDVSQKLGRGRHTTRHIELIKHKFDGYVADTPGFSSLDEYAYDGILKEDLQYLFPEFDDFLGSCKFTSCMHIGEKGCAICKAVEEEKIHRSRYESYLTMYNDVKTKKSWEI